MAKPPMNDTIQLHSVEMDPATGEPKLSRSGQATRTITESAARVKYTAERVYNSKGEEREATLELSLPPETRILAGDIVEWVDRFGITVKEPVISVKELLSYNGKVVYYRKAWAGDK